MHFITLSECLKQKAEQNQGKTALVYKQKKISYNEFDYEVERVASILIEQGALKNDRIALYMEKSLEEAISILAIWRAGGILVNINHMLKPLQIEHILNDSGARFLLTTTPRLKNLAMNMPRVKSLKTVIVDREIVALDDIGIKVVSRDAIDQSPSKVEMPRVVENDIGAIIYTSGSTGKPKGVVVSHRNLMAGAESVAEYVNNSENDRILSVLPFSFDYGLNQLTTSIYSGATCVLINYLVPNDILLAIEKYEITGVGLIPPLWLQVLQKKMDHSRFKAWRYLTNTGGAMPIEAVKSLRKSLPHTKIYLMFGLTEAFRGTYLDPDEIDKRPGSIGKAIPNAEIWIINKNGQHCKPGEIGEIVQRGAHVALGYWNDIERTEQRFKLNPFAPNGLINKEKVLFSGDYAKIDEEGFIYYIGRDDDMIKTLGHRVSPNEIEEVIYMNEKIGHAAAFGMKDEILGQSINLVVAPKVDLQLSEQEILKHCQMNLPNYLVPKDVYIWEKLPLNPNGKIDRKSIFATIRAG